MNGSVKGSNGLAKHYPEGGNKLNAINLERVRQFLDGQLSFEKDTQQKGNIPKQEKLSMTDYIFDQLTHRSFRRTHLDDRSATDLRLKVQGHVQRNEPICFSIPFGGYKNYKIESFPGPDWAEVFSVNYTARYLMPVSLYYAPGVLVYYTYTSGVLDIVSNIPPEATDLYMRQFRSILSLFADNLPLNIRMIEFDISELYDSSELKEELARNYEYNRVHWCEKLPPEERNRHIASAQRNLMRQGIEDLSSLTGKEWEDRCLNSAMWCEALDSLRLRRHFNKYSNNIQLVHVRGPVPSIHIGSCDTSAHHFAAGCGIIEARGSRILQRIISEDKRRNYREMGLVEDVPVDTRFKCISSAFNYISVLASEMGF